MRFFSCSPPGAITALAAPALFAAALYVRPLIPSAAAPSAPIELRVAEDLGGLFAPDVGYSDQNGRRFSADDLAGRLVLLDVMSSSCPSLCAVRALDMAAIDAMLPAGDRAKVRLVSVALGAKDRPPALKAFADALRLEPSRWTLLSSDGDGAVRSFQALGLAPPGASPPDNRDEPPTALFLFDRRGRLMQRYSGRPVDRTRIAREIVALGTYDETLLAAGTTQAATSPSATH